MYLTDVNVPYKRLNILFKYIAKKTCYFKTFSEDAQALARKRPFHVCRSWADDSQILFTLHPLSNYCMFYQRPQYSKMSCAHLIVQGQMLNMQNWLLVQMNTPTHVQILRCPLEVKFKVKLNSTTKMLCLSIHQQGLNPELLACKCQCQLLAPQRPGKSLPSTKDVSYL